MTGPSQSRRRVGILGGTFDPVHNGHLHVAQQVREKLALDKVLLIPTGTPPHKAGRRLQDARHRYAMAIIACHNLRGLEVSDVEVRRDGVSYTIDTVNLLAERMPGTDLFLILGADAAAEIHTWRNAERLIMAVNPVVVFRPGFPVDSSITALEGRIAPDAVDRLLGGCLEIEPVDISSTQVRDRLAAGEPVNGLVRHKVEEYIRSNGLYGVLPD
ncbi:MAG: nicotinate-nucleotide adenylyltransferase [Planctomycetes bacterium]|nr:nicotinate-nucleotide adenylyltransferase [Planctomycetota bacterium]